MDEKIHKGPGALAELVDNIDEVIHQRVRLGIMTTLIALGEADFRLLKETLELTDGNLSTHLLLLENRGYVQIQKEFKGRRPHTTVSPTSKGRSAFDTYLGSLERLLKSSTK